GGGRSSGLWRAAPSASSASGIGVAPLDDRAPGAALRRKPGGARRRQPVVAAPALAGFFDPAALDPAALFEAVEQRIQRSDTELEGAARPRPDQLAQVGTGARLGVRPV